MTNVFARLLAAISAAALTTLAVLALALPFAAHAQTTNVAGNIIANGQIVTTNTTAATSTTTGAIQVTGGAGIGGAVYVGSNLSVTGTSTLGAVSAGAITGTALMGTSLNVGTGPITGGAATVGTISSSIGTTGTGLIASQYIFSDQETVAAGSGTFFIPFFINDVMLSGGTGERQTIQITGASSFVASGQFFDAAQELGHDTGGSGNWFGNNAVCEIDSPTLAGTECTGEEIDTEVKATSNVSVRDGLQVISLATDAGHGSVIDAGILLGQQAGGVGYNIGLQIGTASQNPITSTGTAIDIQQTAMNIGIDISHTTFGIDAIIGPGGFIVNPSGAVGSSQYNFWNGTTYTTGVTCAAGTVSLATLVISGGIPTHC